MFNSVCSDATESAGVIQAAGSLLMTLLDNRVPFNRPSAQGFEIEHVREAVEGGGITAAGGPFTEKVARILRDAHDAPEVLLTTSCTSALEMAALMLDLQPGDTVIVPSFTFVTSALAFVRSGARIRFADIETSTLGIDPRHVEELLDDSVRAVVAVHYAGLGCDIAGLQEVLAPYPDITLIEDNAHGLFGHYRGEPLGSFGRFSTLSFHETKNFVCGEGGALVINDSADVERAHTILDKGTNRRSFALGKVDKYTWVDTGSSFGLADLLAAYLLGQLEAKEEILDLRKEAFNRYYEWLSPYQDDYGYRIPVIPADRVPAYHMFYTIVEDERTRNHVLSEMGDQGLEAVFHYVPLHSSPGGLQAAAGESHCPVTTDISRRLLRLPFHNMLSEEDSKLVVEAFLEAVSSANG